MIQYIQLKKYNTNNSLDVDTTFLVQSHKLSTTEGQVLLRGKTQRQWPGM